MPPKSDTTKTGCRATGSEQPASSLLADFQSGDEPVFESAVIETRVVGGSAGGPASDSAADAVHTLKVVRFESLARCGDEIWIEHEGQLYRLRKTRQGKLILTK